VDTGETIQAPIVEGAVLHQEDALFRTRQSLWPT